MFLTEQNRWTTSGALTSFMHPCSEIPMSTIRHILQRIVSEENLWRPSLGTKAYYALTGPPAVPPRWVACFGDGYGKDRFLTQNDLLEILTSCRAFSYLGGRHILGFMACRWGWKDRRCGRNIGYSLLMHKTPNLQNVRQDWQEERDMQVMSCLVHLHSAPCDANTFSSVEQP